MSQYEGSCICGQLTFQVKVESKEVGMCHCTLCRGWCSGPSLMVHGSERPVVNDESLLGVYQSSDYGERCFCKTCGSNLFWRHKFENFFGISVDAMKGVDDFVLTGEIFIDQRPKFDFPSKNIKRLTAAQFWEMIQSQGSPQ